MTVYLLLTAAVMFACVLLHKLSDKLGIPTLLAFILLGMVFGSDGIFKIPFDNYSFAEQICSVALIFIMFYGGFGTNWNEARPVAVQSVILSSIGVVLTSGLTGLFCHLVLKIDWLESMLIGSVLGSTDAASVFSILRSKRLNLKFNTASLLELESGSNDPFAYMLTVIILSMMNGTASGGGIAYMLFAQLFFGIAFGIIISFLSYFILKNFRIESNGFDAIFVIAVAIVSYAVPLAIGGNGYLSTYIVGIFLGNSNIRHKKTLVPFFDGFTGIMQMLIFFLLGLLSFPSELPQIATMSLIIALFLTFICRPVAVTILLAPFRCTINQVMIISWAGLRGAASIVFAIVAMMNAKIDNDIFHIVFFVVLFSILFQGSLLPVLSKKLGMIDEKGDVMKTFSDYSNEIPVQFVQSSVRADHPWADRMLKDILLPPDTLLVMIQRGNDKIIPNGDTCLEVNDTMILAARSTLKIDDVHLSEITIPVDSTNVGKNLSEIKNTGKALVILILRNNELIIPNGNTQLHANDVLVLNNSEEQSPNA